MHRTWANRGHLGLGLWILLASVSADAFCFTGHVAVLRSTECFRGQQTNEAEEKGAGKPGIKELMSKYGKVALLSHVTIQAFTYGLVYTLVAGYDIDALLNRLPEAISSKVDASAGAFAVTFFLVKTTTPARLLIDAAITPKLAQKLQGTPLGNILGLESKQVGI